MNPLVDRLRQQIIDALSLEEKAPGDIDPAAPLFGDGLGLDSIDALELVVMLEREYGIKITDIEVGRTALTSVQAMAEFIREHPHTCQETE